MWKPNVSRFSYNLVVILLLLSRTKIEKTILGRILSSPSVFGRRLLFSEDFVILFFSYHLLKTVGLEGLPNLLLQELVDFARILVLKKEHSNVRRGLGCYGNLAKSGGKNHLAANKFEYSFNV